MDGEVPRIVPLYSRHDGARHLQANGDIAQR